jgi:hypothetical protein
MKADVVEIRDRILIKIASKARLNLSLEKKDGKEVRVEVQRSKRSVF